MSRGLILFLAIVGGLAWIGTNSGSKSTPAPATRAAVPAATAPTQVAQAIAPIPGVQWRVQTDTSAIDDSKSVYLQVTSDNDIPGKYGGMGPATLLIRCMENTTSVMLKFNDHFMADIQGYGDVTYRIDERKAAKRGFEESTDHEWLGLWNGGAAIPFIKTMLGGEKMIVRATPFSESAIEATFRIGGLEEKIEPLRSACSW